MRILSLMATKVRERMNAKKATKKKTSKKKVLPKKDLTSEAFDVIINEKTGHYELVIIRYDLASKQAYVHSKEFLADSAYRAEFEIKKLLAHGRILPIKG